MNYDPTARRTPCARVQPSLALKWPGKTNRRNTTNAVNFGAVWQFCFSWHSLLLCFFAGFRLISTFHHYMVGLLQSPAERCPSCRLVCRNKSTQTNRQVQCLGGMVAFSFYLLSSAPPRTASTLLPLTPLGSLSSGLC